LAQKSNIVWTLEGICLDILLAAFVEQHSPVWVCVRP